MDPEIHHMLILLKTLCLTSLHGQWLRIQLPMPGTQVPSLVREDCTCRRAAKSMCCSYWACECRACALQQEKPPQWEALTPQLASSPHSPQLPMHSNKDTVQPEINKDEKKRNCYSSIAVSSVSLEFATGYSGPCFHHCPQAPWWSTPGL